MPSSSDDQEAKAEYQEYLDMGGVRAGLFHSAEGDDRIVEVVDGESKEEVCCGMPSRRSGTGLWCRMAELR